MRAIGDNPDCIVIAARVRAARNAPRLRRFANRCADFWIGLGLWCGVVRQPIRISLLSGLAHPRAANPPRDAT